jgi:hypothetical protein
MLSPEWNLHMQGIHENEIKAAHGYHSGHLGVWDAEHGSEKVLRQVDRAMGLIVANADRSIEVGRLEVRESSESIHDVRIGRGSET